MTHLYRGENVVNLASGILRTIAPSKINTAARLTPAITAFSSTAVSRGVANISGDFFTSASTQTPPHPWLVPADRVRLREIDALDEVKEHLWRLVLLPIPSTLPESATHADVIWQAYRSLSPSRRLALSAQLKRHVLHRVAPLPYLMAAHALASFGSPKSGTSERATVLSPELCAPAKLLAWEKRFALVMSDMAQSATTSTEVTPSSLDYLYIAKHFQAIGHISGCESIAEEMRNRRLSASVEMATCRLAAVTRWLVLHAPPVDLSERLLLAQRLLSLVQSILSEMQSAGLSLQRLTVDLLFRIVVYLRRDYAPDFAPLDELFEEVLERGYDTADHHHHVAGETVNDEGLPRISRPTLNLVLRDLGERGRCWDMLSIFSSLDAEQSTLGTSVPKHDETSNGPSLTLSDALQQEAQQGGRLSFFGRRLVPESSATPNFPVRVQMTSPAERITFYDYLSSVPLPSTSFLGFNTTKPSEALHLLQSVTQRETKEAQTVGILIKYAVASRDRFLSLHLLRVGVRKVLMHRTEWYASLSRSLSNTEIPRPMPSAMKHSMIPDVLHWIKLCMRFKLSVHHRGAVLHELRRVHEHCADEVRVWDDLEASKESGSDTLGPGETATFDRQAFVLGLKEEVQRLAGALGEAELSLARAVARRKRDVQVEKQKKRELRAGADNTIGE